LGYVTREEIRNLTGLTDLEIDDQSLDQIITDAENLIDAYTGKTWTTTDAEYPKIKTVTRLLAASLIYEGLPSTPEAQGKAQRYHELATLMLKSMRIFSSGPLKRT